MKKNLLLIIITVIFQSLTISLSFAGTPDLNKTATINQSDSVFFDLNKAVVAGNKISIPVYMLTDDTVVTLDFSLKYNLAKLIYDSIITAKSYVYPTFNQDTTKTIYFTSFSTGSNYDNNTTLVYIRFTWLSSPICDSDLYNVKAYLNGTACSVKVPSSCFAVGMPVNSNAENFVTVYPNPANGILNVDFALPNVDKATVQLLDMEGRQIAVENNINADQKLQINIANIVSGFYMIRIYNDKFLYQKKLVID